MKKKHRRAVCNALCVIWLIITSPLLILGYLGELAVTIGGYVAINPMNWLKTKLRVYDDDPD